MDGIDKITEKIIRDATEEARVIIQVALEKAVSISRKFEVEAKESYDQIIKQAHDKEKDIIKHGSYMANLEGRKQLLFTKQAIIDEVFKEAFSRIKQKNGPTYIEFLSKFAANNSINGNGEMIFCEGDRVSIGKDIVNKANQILMSQCKISNLILSEETRPIDGGFILKTEEIEVNCTIDALYNEKRNELSFEVAEQLFGN